MNTDEVTAPGRVSVGAQEAFGQRTRPGTNASRAWDLDEMMFDSHGNLGVDGRLPTDRPHVVKVYGSYLFKFGTNVGLNFYGGSGTPISKSVQSIYRYPILVEGRGSLGRTDALTQTDLLVSHEFGLGGHEEAPPRVQRAEHLQPEAGAARVRHGQPHRRERPRARRARRCSWPTRTC